MSVKINKKDRKTQAVNERLTLFLREERALR